ncbi:histone deacetylase 11 isoform X2 [Pongo pygmaeus]|uniref:histone deacetylase 11 isoform X2 n=1 Tax=Pongo pygmaeus TaxID=9600 RepID=UPI0023E18E01|nr:histone deacetylase 11 isoform X2 [Pongo pygmaeus]
MQSRQAHGGPSSNVCALPLCPALAHSRPRGAQGSQPGSPPSAASVWMAGTAGPTEAHCLRPLGLYCWGLLLGCSPTDTPSCRLGLAQLTLAVRVRVGNGDACTLKTVTRPALQRETQALRAYMSSPGVLVLELLADWAGGGLGSERSRGSLGHRRQGQRNSPAPTFNSRKQGPRDASPRSHSEAPVQPAGNLAFLTPSLSPFLPSLGSAGTGPTVVAPLPRRRGETRAALPPGGGASEPGGIPPGICLRRRDFRLHTTQLYQHVPETRWPIVYSPRYNITFMGLEKLHPFDAGKWGKVINFLKEEKLLSDSMLVEAREASEEDLLVVHTRRYLNELKFLFERVEGISRATIIDLDAHQGNGHERDFMDDKRVYIMDVYNRHIYPGDRFAKQAIRRKVELEWGTEDDEYLDKVERNIKKSLQEHLPDVVVYNAGTDILEGDRLGGLSISPAGIVKRDELVFRMVRGRRVPILMVTSGGYQKRTARIIADSILNLFGLGLIGPESPSVSAQNSDTPLLPPAVP